MSLSQKSYSGDMKFTVLAEDLLVNIIVQSTLCISCFFLRIQPKIQKGKKQLFPPLCNQIFGSPMKNSQNLIYSFDVWVVPTWGNPNSQRKRISNVKQQSNNPLNYKGSYEKYMGFSQIWRQSGIIFVKCGLIYYIKLITFFEIKNGTKTGLALPPVCRMS